MPAYKSEDYAEAVGVIRAIEKRLLNAGALERVLETPDAADALRLLTQIGEYDFGALDHAVDYEDVLKQEIKRVYERLRKLSPTPDVVEVLSLKYDYHNVKTALKAQYAAIDAAGMMCDMAGVSPRMIMEAVKTGDGKNLPKHLAEAIAQGIVAFEKTGEPGSIDLALDRLMYTETHRRANRLGCALIIEFVRKTIDFYNLKTLLRIRAMRADVHFLKNALADGGAIPTYFFEDAFPKSDDTLFSSFQYKYFSEEVKNALEDHVVSGHFSLLEKLSDDHLMECLQKAKRIPFGPEPLFAYCYAKEIEIRQIRIILTGKFNKVPSESLRKRLRACYV